VVTGERLVDNRYRVTGPGQDGHRPGWRAEDERLRRPVTILRLPPGTVSADQIRVYSRLTDDRLIRILDLELTGTTELLVVELHRGLRYADLLAGGLLTTPTATELIAEAAAAVALVHSAGLAYGELAAESICWTDSGLVKVLDVPLATATPDAVARDLDGLQRLLRSALDPGTAPRLRTLLRTEFDSVAELVAALEPFRRTTGSLRRQLVSPEPAEAPHRLAGCRVRELMATDVLTVSEDTPVLELAELLAGCQHQAVPVVDSAGRVTGMISPAELAHWRLGMVGV